MTTLCVNICEVCGYGGQLAHKTMLLVSYMPLANWLRVSVQAKGRSPLPHPPAKPAFGVPSYTTKNSSHGITPPRQL